MSSSIFVACLECDMLYRRTPLPRGGEARCTRCGGRLYRRPSPAANQRALALSLTACILFVIANVYPLVVLEVQGTRTSATLISAVQSLWTDEARAMATLVFATTILVPAAELAGLTWVLAVLRWSRRGRGAVAMLHFIESVKAWSMLDVFVLGVLVSLVKLAHIATIVPGIALYSFGALMLFLAAAAAAFDPDAAWMQLETTR